LRKEFKQKYLNALSGKLLRGTGLTTLTAKRTGFGTIALLFFALALIGTTTAFGQLSTTCQLGWVCKEPDLAGYSYTDCSWEELKYCPNGCIDGECASDECIAGDTCYDSITKANKTIDCVYRNLEICPNGCVNGACVANGTCTPGWKCKDEKTKANQASDCTWRSLQTCLYGCSNGSCKAGPQPCESKQVTIDAQTFGAQYSDCSIRSLRKCGVGWEYFLGGCRKIQEPKTCSVGWKCKSADISAYQDKDCGWMYPAYCKYGCSNGKCLPNPSACKAGWVCKSDGFTKAYQNGDCSLGDESVCLNGCEGGYNGFTGAYCKGSTFLDKDGTKKSCFNGGFCLHTTVKALMASDCSYTQKTDCKETCENGECVCMSDRWICSKVNNEKYAIKRNRDCSIAEKIKCDYGCSSGKCDCANKWVCKDSSTRAHQIWSCGFEEQEKCKYGCVDGVCIACAKDSDCSSLQSTELFCKNNDLYTKSAVPKCENPGAATAVCTSTIKETQSKDCGENYTTNDQYCEGDAVVKLTKYHTKGCLNKACYDRVTQ